MDHSPDFASALARLHEQPPVPNAVYYDFELAADEDGTRYVSVGTHWVGEDRTFPRRELRAPTPIDPFKAVEVHRNHFGGAYAVVNDDVDLLAYELSGGRAAVRAPLAAELAPHLVETRACVRSVTDGFVGVDHAPPAWLRRAPSKRTRMRVLKRDRLRCRICGRSPDDFVDVTLHVHHIVPWGRGGLTEDDNLVTLCATCHDGLDPHYDPDLFRSIGLDPTAYLHRSDPVLDAAAVRRYRLGVLNVLGQSASGGRW